MILFCVQPQRLCFLQKCEEKLDIKDDEPIEELVSVQDLGGKKQILIIDDSALSLRNIKAVLDKRYEVIVAKSGEKGLQLAKKNRPDLILLDYEMPGWDGRKTLEEIRNDEETMEIPVMFLTGIADKDYFSAVLGLNPAGYLLKPIDQSRLLSMTEELLGE